MTSENSSRECTTEYLFAGRLICRQHLHGYRFTQDPVLLANFFVPSPDEKIIDLGTGCGIIPLILARRWSGVSITALEVQPALALLARGNVELNNLAGRILVMEGDLKKVAQIFPAGGFDRVVCNPPYHPAGAARLNPDPEQAIARHELMVTLDDVVAAASWLLAEGGRLDLVYPVNRLNEALATLEKKGLTPVRLREVHGYPGGNPLLVMVEAVKGRERGLEVLPPLFLRLGPAGEYTEEIARFYEL